MFLTALRVSSSRITMLLFVLFATVSVLAQNGFEFERAQTKIVLSEKRNELIFAVRTAQETENARLSLEILDRENKVVAQSTQTLKLAKGLNLIDSKIKYGADWKDNLTFRTLAERSDFPTCRLRYRIEADGAKTLSETISLSQIAPTLFDVRTAAAERTDGGTNYVVRVRAFQTPNEIPLAGVKIRAVVKLDFEDDREPDEKKFALDGVSDENGLASFSFPLPKDRPIEDGDVEISGQYRGVEIAHSEDLEFDEENRSAFYLSADKPIYQPGQTLNVRGVLLDKMRRARADAKLEVEIKSPDYDTMFAAEMKTSRFGIASFSWKIPENVRLGEYRINVEDDDNNDIGVLNIKISRYELPNFAVSAKAEKSFYLIDETKAQAEIRADYLFGKPVTNGTWRVVREAERRWNYEKQKWEVEEKAEYKGTLKDDGTAQVELDISEAAKTLNNNPWQRFVDLNSAVYVTDATTNRTEQKRFGVRVSRQPIHVYLSGRLDRTNPALPVEFFVTTFYADGSPAVCDVEINGGYKEKLVKTGDAPTDAAESERLYQKALTAHNLTRTQTDKLGAGRVSFLAPDFDANEETLLMQIKARDKDGKIGTFDESEDLDRKEEMLRVTPRKALIKNGAPIELDIVSTRREGLVYIDVERRFSTIASSAVYLKDGAASVKIPFNAKFRNDLAIHAYAEYLDKDGERDVIQDRKAVVYPQPDNLTVRAEVSKTVFRPSEEGSLKFDVLTSDKKRAETALGIVVFDKAIEERARTDREFGGSGGGDNFFGSLGALFYVAGFGNVTLRDINQLQPKDFTPELDRAVRLMLHQNQRYNYYDTNFFGGDFYTENNAVAFGTLLDKQFAPLGKNLTAQFKANGKAARNFAELSTMAGNIDVRELRDPWESTYRIDFTPNEKSIVVSFVSAGADEVFDTKDDFTARSFSFQYFLNEGTAIDKAVGAYYSQTARFVRDEATLRRVLAEKGFAAEDLRDGWNRPLKIEFDVSGSDYVIRFHSAGADGKFEKVSPYNYYYDGEQTDDFYLWETRTDYYNEKRRELEKALDAYLKQGNGFPQNLDELKKAFAASGIAIESLRDIYDRPLIFDFDRASRYADRVTIESTANFGEQPKEVRRITPVTQEYVNLYVRSAGADGKDETYTDNFSLAVFSVVISEKTRTDVAPSPTPTPTSSPVEPKPKLAPVVSVEGSGAIRGTVTDANGAIIAGAKISIVSADGENTYTTETDEDGEYIVKNLPSGIYRVEADYIGFKKSVVNSVVVRSMTLTLVDFNLEVGTVSATVEVAASVPRTIAESITVDVSASISETRNEPQMTGNVNNSSEISTPRLREYFPETLVWLPEVVTDKRGRAEVKFKLADNLTTWKIAVIGSTLDGEIGLTTREFQTFMPFFAELDPPKFLTVGDRIALPVPLRNYLDKPQTVTATFDAQNWFEMLNAPTQNVNVAPNSTTNAVFDFRAVRAVAKGKQRVTAVSQNDREAADAIEKTLDVRPHGREVVATNGAVFRENTAFEVNFPNDALPATPRAEVKIYPNLTAHIAESIEGVLRRPDGCGEQTTSSAYPNLIYLQLAGKNGDAAQKAKALENLQFGYTRLLAYQKPNGGFGYWTKDDETDLTLTAYVVRFLTESAEFIEVDQSVVSRAKRFLRSAQRADGSWTKMYASDKTEDLRRTAIITAYIARSLAQASSAKDAETSPVVRAALAYLQTKTPQFADEPYSLATYALASLAIGEREKASQIALELAKLAKREGTGAFWNLETNTPFYGWGLPARIETTALVVQVFERLNREAKEKNAEFSDLTNKGLQFLLKNKDRYGVWYSSQTTVNVLGAIVEVSRESESGNRKSEAKNSVTIIVNGREMQTLDLPNYDAVTNPLTIDVTTHLQGAKNRVEIRQNGAPRTATANVVNTHYVAWTKTDASGTRVNDSDGLRLEIGYDKTEAAVLSEISCRVEAERVGFRGYGMLLAEIGLPPGADVDRASLEEVLQSANGVSRYDVLPDRVIFYLWATAGGSQFEFKFKPRLAMKAHTAPSQIYDYYNPESNAVIAPTQFDVR